MLVGGNIWYFSRSRWRQETDSPWKRVAVGREWGGGRWGDGAGRRGWKGAGALTTSRREEERPGAGRGGGGCLLCDEILGGGRGRGRGKKGGKEQLSPKAQTQTSRQPGVTHVPGPGGNTPVTMSRVIYFLGTSLLALGHPPSPGLAGGRHLPAPSIAMKRRGGRGAERLVEGDP